MAQITNQTTDQTRNSKIGATEVINQQVWNNEFEPDIPTRQPTGTQLFSKQAELLKSLKSKIPNITKPEPNLSASHFSEQHFVELVSLGIDLGLDNEVNELLSTSHREKRDLTGFLDTILNKFHSKISDKFMPKKAKMINSLIDALNKDGQEITKEQYILLEKKMETLNFDSPLICVVNYSYDGTEDYYLAVSHAEIETIPIDNQNSIKTLGGVGELIYSELEEISTLAMVVTDNDITEMNCDLNLFEDYLGADFIKHHNSPDDILAQALGTDLFNDLGIEDEEEFLDNYDTLMNALFSLKDNKEKLANLAVEHKNSHLLNWFKEQINALKEHVSNQNTFLEATGHYYNLQFSTINEYTPLLVEQAMAEYQELPDCQSKVLLENSLESTVEFLTASALARELFNILNALITSENPNNIWSKKSITQLQLNSVNFLSPNA